MLTGKRGGMWDVQESVLLLSACGLFCTEAPLSPNLRPRIAGVPLLRHGKLEGEPENRSGAGDASECGFPALSSRQVALGIRSPPGGLGV